jgi:hypothetical protein
LPPHAVSFAVKQAHGVFHTCETQEWCRNIPAGGKVVEGRHTDVYGFGETEMSDIVVPDYIAPQTITFLGSEPQPRPEPYDPAGQLTGEEVRPQIGQQVVLRVGVTYVWPEEAVYFVTGTVDVLGGFMERGCADTYQDNGMPEGQTEPYFTVAVNYPPDQELPPVPVGYVPEHMCIAGLVPVSGQSYFGGAAPYGVVALYQVDDVGAERTEIHLHIFDFVVENSHEMQVCVRIGNTLLPVRSFDGSGVPTLEFYTAMLLEVGYVPDSCSSMAVYILSGPPREPIGGEAMCEGEKLELQTQPFAPVTVFRNEHPSHYR